MALAGCPGNSGGGGDGGGGSASSKSPSGIYICNLPDNSSYELDFQAGGKVTMTLTENGVKDVGDASWVANGDSIIVDRKDSMMAMSLQWKGEQLVWDMAGMPLTFTKK